MIKKEPTRVTYYLNQAVTYILEREKDTHYVCDRLAEHPVERIVCQKHCTGLDEFCVKRMLKHYSHD